MRLGGFLGLVAALAVASSGCAENSTDGSTTLYFLTADGSAPIAVRRAGTLSAAEVLQQLLAGPTSDEHDRGITTAFPEDVKVRSLRVERGDARMDFSGLPQTSSAVERFRIITQLTKTLVGRSGIARVWLRNEGQAWGLWLMRGGIKEGPYTNGPCTGVGMAKPGTETVIADSFWTCRG